MIDNIPCLDDVDLNRKCVLLRIDINTPMDPDTGEFLDDYRFQLHKETIQELVEKNSRVVICAHQGRPGWGDFTTLERHADKLSEILGQEVEYVDDIFGSYARSKIKRLDNGEILLLENVRFYSEENLNRSPREQAQTHMVKKLSPLADIFINDAFSAAHRSQTSLVGFTPVLSSAAGRLMEKELKTLWGVMKDPKLPLVFILAGNKPEDSLKIIKKIVDNEQTYILAGGVIANIFLMAKGYDIGKVNVELIKKLRTKENLIDIAKSLMETNGEKILVPDDLALNDGGSRVEIAVEELPKNLPIYGIGHKTIERYIKLIKTSKTVFMNGTLGVFEQKKFTYGTEKILNEIANSNIFSVIGGGHTVAAAHEFDVEDKIDHVSSGGGACITLLSGDPLPAVEALRKTD